MKRSLQRFAGLLAAAAALAAPAAGESVLKFIPHADLKVIDPIATTAYISRNHGYLVYDVLFAQDEKLAVQPQMVESWQVSDDRMSYTFKLRPGLRFHDGQPVGAEDVIASLQRWGKRDGLGQQLMGATDRLEKVDEASFRLVLKQPFGLVLAALGKISSNVPFIMPKRIAETDPTKNIEEATGLGPYIFRKEDWRPGAKVVYAKNPDYKPRPEPASGAAGGKIAHFDRIEWLYIPDNTTAMNAILGGEVDYFENPPIDLLPAMQADPNVYVHNLATTQGWMALNSLHPPFDNPKMRQAMQAVVDQRQYMLAAVGEPKLFEVCGAIYVCGTPLASETGSERLVKADVELAKKLMAEAGYKGEPIVLMHPTDIPTLNAFSQVTAELMRKAGMNVEVQAVDWSTVVARRAKKEPPKEGGWNVFHTQWVAPDVWDPALNRATQGGGTEKGWFGWFADAELESLSAAYVREPDEAKRREIAHKLQLRWMETAPVVTLGQYATPAVIRKEVTGVLKAPVPFLWNLKKG